MKSLFLTVVSLMFVSMGAIAATETTKNENTAAEALHGEWHCTAYDPHGHGYSSSDHHYDHAYHAAVEQCEHSSGHHCHDVHCHQH